MQECQEKEGLFMMAFPSPVTALEWALTLQLALTKYADVLEFAAQSRISLVALPLHSWWQAASTETTVFISLLACLNMQWQHHSLLIGSSQQGRDEYVLQSCTCLVDRDIASCEKLAASCLLQDFAQFIVPAAFSTEQLNCQQD